MTQGADPSESPAVTRREIGYALVAMLVATVATSAVAYWRLSPSAGATTAATADDDKSESEKLTAENARLVDSLREANRTIAALREKLPAGSPSAQEPAQQDRDPRKAAPHFFPEPTPDEWQQAAKRAAYTVRTPCLRDPPFSPPPHALDRLGLAPDDATSIRDAYAHSNKRVTDVIMPLCAKVLGHEDLAKRLGPKACTQTIVAAGRRNPESMHKSVVRVAEFNAGTGQAPSGGPPVEQLALALTKEAKLFEAELVEKLGPDDAKRTALANEMCADYVELTATY